MVLARRCFLGASVQDTADGVRVLRTWPGSMAASAGAQAGDRIECFGAPVQTVAQLVAACRAQAGEAAELVLVRDGEPRTLRVPYLPFPAEHSPHGQLTYGTLSHRGAQVRTILVTPPDADTAVVFLPGIEWQSVDYALRERCPSAQLLSDLSRLGLATFRVERPGLGDSPGPPCDGFLDEQAVYRAGLRSLADDPRFTSVVLFGHSVGGMHAPMLADLADALITYGSSARRWSQCLDEGHARQLAMRGMPPQPRAPGWPPQRPRRFHEELDGQDLGAHWRSLVVPSLVLIGEYDWVVSSEEQLELPGEHVVLGGLDHALTRHDSLEESLSRFGRGSGDDQIARRIHAWLNAPRR
ncbi:MAG TPA: alpha/beta fold hydrolase [Polyangiaceae bacterium]|nr:alpha/beta fold hydrolase [Polyangiaceae bacterium]